MCELSVSYDVPCIGQLAFAVYASLQSYEAEWSAVENMRYGVTYGGVGLRARAPCVTDIGRSSVETAFGISVADQLAYEADTVPEIACNWALEYTSVVDGAIVGDVAAYDEIV